MIRVAVVVMVAFFVVLGLIGTDVIPDGYTTRDRWLHEATAQCGERGVKDIKGIDETGHDTVICRNGKVVIR